jgi:hypothetical protein
MAEITRKSLYASDLTESAASNHYDPIQAELLSTLLSSVNELRSDVSKLRNDNATILNEVQHLQKNNAFLSNQVRGLQEQSGAKFSRFGVLPVEIRAMIWTIALTAPQIHIWTELVISRSRVNEVMLASREARDICLRLKLPYYIVAKDCYPQRRVPHGVRNYLNYDCDVIWNPGDPKYRFFPEHIAILCNRCPPYPEGDYQSGQPREIPDGCPHTYRLGAMAINYSHWKGPSVDDEGWWDPGSMENLWFYENVRELYIVINEDDQPQSRDVVFVKAKGMPLNRLPDISLGDPGSVYFDELAKHLIKGMEDFKVQRAEYRKHEIEGVPCRYILVDFANKWQ